jgi:RNase P subunit RPR2
MKTTKICTRCNTLFTDGQTVLIDSEGDESCNQCYPFYVKLKNYEVRL